MGFLHIPQGSIKVGIEFYNQDEQEKFKNYPSFNRIETITKSGVIEIPTAEFLAYYLFYRKRPGSPGYRSYEDLGLKIAKALDELDGWVEFNGHSISACKGAIPFNNAVTERIGESVALSVVNRIHDLTEADWDRIPEKQTKTFDFKLDPIASDGVHVIQVEAKGSCTQENDKKSTSIYNQKASIVEKKKSINNIITAIDSPHLLYGAITEISYDYKAPIRCLLVDPEPDKITTPPRKIRLINRMRFLRDWVSFISPRSQLAATLASRVKVLEVMKDPFELDGVPLLKGNMEQFYFEESPYKRGGPSSAFFTYRSHLTDGPSGGIITKLSRNALFFVGFRQELLQLTADQNFQEVMSYRSRSGVVKKHVRCVLTERRFKQMHLPAGIKNMARTENGYVSFVLEGNIAFNDSGILFGVLPTTGNELP